MDSTLYSTLKVVYLFKTDVSEMSLFLRVLLEYFDTRKGNSLTKTVGFYQYYKRKVCHSILKLISEKINVFIYEVIYH